MSQLRSRMERDGLVALRILFAVFTATLAGYAFARLQFAGRLVLHRFRSRWNAEGRHAADTIEDLCLEPSWARFSVRCEKFGTTGSMPVRGFFPFAAIEDTGAGVIWASLTIDFDESFDAVAVLLSR